MLKNSLIGECESSLSKTKLKLPPWIERVSENATEGVARWEELKVETIGVAHLIKVSNCHNLCKLIIYKSFSIKISNYFPISYTIILDV